MVFLFSYARISYTYVNFSYLFADLCKYGTFRFFPFLVVFFSSRFLCEWVCVCVYVNAHEHALIMKSKQNYFTSRKWRLKMDEKCTTSSSKVPKISARKRRRKWKCIIFPFQLYQLAYSKYTWKACYRYGPIIIRSQTTRFGVDFHLQIFCIACLPARVWLKCSSPVASIKFAFESVFFSFLLCFFFYVPNWKCVFVFHDF